MVRNKKNSGDEPQTPLPEKPLAPGRILIVDDEADARESCAAALTRLGNHEVRMTQSPFEARTIARNWLPEVILLDIEMPEMDGLTLARRLHEDGCDAHLMFVTRRNLTRDYIQGIDVADQYLTKPFDDTMLLSYVNAMLRRRRMTHGASPGAGAGGTFRLDQATRSITIPPRPPVRLTARQWEILDVLVRSRGKVVTKEGLLERVWHSDEDSMGLVEVNISRLRKRIERDPSAPEIIISATHGYRFAL